MDFIKNNNEVTTNAILNLYLFYLKLFSQRKENDKGTFPIPYYALDCFYRYDCDKQPINILDRLSSREKIDQLYKIYYMTTYNYTKYYTTCYNIGYNAMIKQSIDYDKMEEYYLSETERINLNI